AVAENVVRGGEEAAARFGKTVNAIAVWFAQERDPTTGVTILFLVRTVSAGQPRNLRVAGPKSRFCHAQRIEEALLEKLLVGHAADDFNDARGDIHALVAIGVFVARLRLERTGDRTDSTNPQRRAVRSSDLLKFGGTRQSTGVAQNMADRDRANQRFEQNVRLILFLHHHPFLELRDETSDWVVQAHLAFVYQHHDGRAGEHFGHRSDPKHFVFGHRFLGLDIRIAKNVPVMNLAGLVGNDGYDARQFVAVQVR